MSTRPVDPHDVERLLGPIADHGVARILAAGATTDELVEAWERLTQEDGVVARVGQAPERVQRLMETLREVWEDEADEDEEVDDVEPTP